MSQPRQLPSIYEKENRNTLQANTSTIIILIQKVNMHLIFEERPLKHTWNTNC